MSTWLTVLFAIELGFTPQYQSLNIQPELLKYEQTLSIGYVQMDIELELFDLIFIGGKMKTGIQGTQIINNFHPFELSSLFNAGARFGNFEFGWRHLCIHPIRPFEIIYNTESSFNGGYNEYYIKYTGVMK